MAMTRQDDRRKESRRRSNRRKGNVKIIKIEGEGKKDQQVTVRQGTVLQRKEISIWGWHEEFAVQWSETFITKKRKTI